MKESRIAAPNCPLPYFDVVTQVRYGTPQGVSVVAHIVVVAVLLTLLAAPKSPLRNGIDRAIPSPARLLYPLPPSRMAEQGSLGRSGRGGAEDADSARRGETPSVSSMPLAPPRIPRSSQVELAVPPAVFEKDAPQDVAPMANLGLPWNTKETNALGTGKGQGVGDKGGDGAGDFEGNGRGIGSDGTYANVARQPACLYCPEPPYTDEARKAKLQGKLTVRVLVGADGCAKRMQVVQGLGSGLDESALETIRNWRFTPARDAGQRPLTSWVLIETRFQLF